MDKISNETTKKLLHDNPEYKSIFKALLGSLKSPKPDDYKSLVMTPNIVKLFNDIVGKINIKIENSDNTDNLSFDSYLKTIKNKTIVNLDINNAPENIQKANQFPQQEFELKDTNGALSFADFKKKDEKKKEEKEEKKEIKSIEDMIKDLKKTMDNMSDEIKDIKSEQKKEDSKIDDIKKESEEEKSDDKDDSKKSDDKKENNKEEEKSDENEESNEDEKDDDSKDSNNNDEDDSKDDDSGDKKESDKDKDTPSLGGL